MAGVDRAQRLRSSLVLRQRHLSPEQFNALVRPFSDTHDTARLMTPIFSSQGDSLTYQPFKRQSGRHVAEVETIEGRRLVNTYRPPDVKPMEGDPGPWLEFMAHLIPDDRDRLETMRWCATLVATEIKMTYALLLISETQGVGKSTLWRKNTGAAGGNAQRVVPVRADDDRE